MFCSHCNIVHVKTGYRSQAIGAMNTVTFQATAIKPDFSKSHIFKCARFCSLG